MLFIDRLLEWWGVRYVIADPNDNSITLSKSLFKAIGKLVDKDVQPKAFVFRVGDEYGFTLNPSFEEKVPLCDIQYNEKYKCIGFESLYPSVTKIFYDYGLPDMPVWLAVKRVNTVLGEPYFLIKKPNGINIERYKKARHNI